MAAGVAARSAGGRVLHEAIWGPIGALALLAARFFPFHLAPRLGLCPLKTLTGVPCFSCGGTRALIALTHGDLPGALACNPGAALLGLAAAAYVVHAAAVALGVWGPWRPDVRSPRLRLALRAGAVAAVLGNWAYLILAGR